LAAVPAGPAARTSKDLPTVTIGVESRCAGADIQPVVLDHEQIGELREWAKGLAEDERPELQAAARAILLLADDLVAARSQLLEHEWIKQALADHESGVELDHTLRHRIRHILGARKNRPDQ
jgi:hypothetical protein